MSGAIPSEEYWVDVPTVGKLRCKRRTIMDEMRVGQLFSEYLGGVAFPTDWLRETAQAMSLLRIVVVGWPEGFDLDALDPLDPDTFETITSIAGAVRVREDEFRREVKAKRQG